MTDSEEPKITITASKLEELAKSMEDVSLNASYFAAARALDLLAEQFASLTVDTTSPGARQGAEAVIRKVLEVTRRHAEDFRKMVKN